MATFLICFGFFILVTICLGAWLNHVSRDESVGAAWVCLILAAMIASILTGILAKLI